MGTVMRERLQLTGLVVLLPLLMAAVGGWEVSRGSGMAALYENQAQQEAHASRPPMAAHPDEQVTGADRTTADLASAAAADAVTLRRDALVWRLRLVMAWIAIAGALVSCAAGLGGWLLALRGAARARLSRDALLTAFTRVANALPLVFGLMVSGFCASVAGIALFELSGLWFLDTLNRLELRVLFAGLLLAGGAIWLAIRTVIDLRRALARLHPEPRPILARAVSPETAPVLFRFVGEVAGRIGAQVPDTILLGLVEGFFVTSSDLELVPTGERVQGHTLHLAAPLLGLFDADETASVISHELAHFTGEDTAYSLRFLPIYGGMRRSLNAVASGLRPIRQGGLPLRASVTLGQHMLESFHGAVAHWSRLRELEADQSMLAATRNLPAASALLRSGAASPLVAAVLERGAARPGAMSDMVAEIVRRAELEALPDPRGFLEASQPHPFDTHPPASVRVEAFGIPLDDALAAHAARRAGPGEAAFVSSLFVDWPMLCTALTSDALTVAAENDRRERARLTAMAAAAAQSTAVHEAASPRHLLAPIGYGVLSLVFGSLVVGVAATDAGSSDDLLFLASGVFILLCGVVLLGSAVAAVRRARQGPLMELTATGMRIRGLAEEVPWEAIDDVRLSWRRTVAARFDLRAGSTPVLAGRWPRRVRCERGGRVLCIFGIRPKGLTPQQLMDLLVRYRRAHAAGLMLKAAEPEDGQAPS